MCGATVGLGDDLIAARGLSPRVRGNPDISTLSDGQMGSIPACAGQPSLCGSCLSRAWVYPRVCGATSMPDFIRVSSTGLSPRVRGNHGDDLLQPDIEGSIPACAGQPNACLILSNMLKVYPRVCGATPKRNHVPSVPQGLSPRVRGNLPEALAHPLSARSIPACAGQPGRRECIAFRERVYPRVCGATCSASSTGSR